MEALRWYFLGIGSVIAAIGILAALVQWLGPKLDKYDRGHP